MAESISDRAQGHAMGLGFTVAAAQVFGKPATIPSGQSFAATVLKRGALESVGFYHEGGVNKGFLGLAERGAARGFLSTAAKALPLAFTGVLAYQGYQEEGIWGATKGVAESIAYSAAWHGGEALLGSGLMAGLTGVAAIAAVGVAAYGFGEAAQAHRKRLTGLEFGSPSVDMLNSAGALTSRARAMNALHSTHINARIAIGNEALLGHTAYRP